MKNPPILLVPAAPGVPDRTQPGEPDKTPAEAHTPAYRAKDGYRASV